MGKQTRVGGRTFYWGTGRRKTAVARVRVADGDGKVFINKIDGTKYFPTDLEQDLIRAPLRSVDLLGKLDIHATIRGGGRTGQAGALSHGIARALKEMNPDFDAPLRERKLLTRDPREKERKKYGHKKARKSFQFSKR